jgi:hypothetical protein
MADGTLERIRARAQQDAAFRRQLMATPLAALREYDLTDQARPALVVPNLSYSTSAISGHRAGNAKGDSTRCRSPYTGGSIDGET